MGTGTDPECLGVHTFLALLLAAIVGIAVGGVCAVFLHVLNAAEVLALEGLLVELQGQSCG